MKNKLALPTVVFLTVLSLLFIVNSKTSMLLLERIFTGGGFLQAFFIAVYGGILAFKMQMAEKSAKWRRISWTIFSVWFFLQVTIGVLFDERFLLTGKLHLPVPAMLLIGPIFRSEISVMTILFISTVLLTGPAWCSHLCYFGAIDSIASGKTRIKQSYRVNWRLKIGILALTILVAFVLKLLKTPTVAAISLGIGIGIIGIGIMIFYSRKSGSMIHCSSFCPIGTIVSLLRKVNPFRLKISNSCTKCMKCTSYCRYGALGEKDIQEQKPALSCTLCGDCISNCHSSAINYHFLGLSPSMARNLYLFTTISIHSIFLAMGRI